jgi:hypothetical protein
MKTLMLLLAALFLIGCGENKSSTSSPYSGNYIASGKACVGYGGVLWTCDSSIVPPACASVTTFNRIHVDQSAIFGTLGTGEHSHLTITSNKIKHDSSGIEYRFYERLCEATEQGCRERAPVVFEFAPGCALEFNRLNY